MAQTFGPPALVHCVGGAAVTHLQGPQRRCPLPTKDTRLLGSWRVGAGTVSHGRHRQMKTSIRTPEEVSKWFALTLSDTDTRKTTTSHIPHTPSRCPHGATLLPCATTRCYCGATMPNDAPTTLKVASVVNVPPPHAQSSHSGEETALALLDQDEVLEDDFQTQHTPVHHVKWRGDSGDGASAGGGPECSGGSLGWRAVYRLDIGEEEETLKTVDPTWQMTRWLQLVVQGISDDKVLWYECIAPLTSGAEGVALSLAKRLLAIWRWSVRVQGWDVCPPTRTVLNIRQFMTRDEV